MPMQGAISSGTFAGFRTTTSPDLLGIASLGRGVTSQPLQLFEAMAGNSSSGVIEAPLVGMPVLNIGRSPQDA